ncbi:MAG: hypothetical protein L3J58_11720 [Emcibacter sp.]|nr:hypothetical protein [Emcibacter sp.]
MLKKRKKPLIIFGSVGGGKTRNSKALAEFFGKTIIIDPVDLPKDFDNMGENDIGFCNSVPPVPPKTHSVISYEDAMIMMNRGYK